MDHLPRWLLLTAAVIAVLAGLMEVRFLRRGVGSSWRLLAYTAFGFAFLLYARQAKAAPAVGQVVARRQEGSGRLVSSSRTYPLGALTYVGSSGGRGILDLKLGPGSLLLSGGEADATSPTSWALKIDRIMLVSQRPVAGVCDLTLTPDGQGYAGLDCRGVIKPDDEPFAVRWRGDGSATRRVPRSLERP